MREKPIALHRMNSNQFGEGMPEFTCESINKNRSFIRIICCSSLHLSYIIPSSSLFDLLARHGGPSTSGPAKEDVRLDSAVAISTI